MIYRFGACELDEARHELRRSGQVVPIEPKVFQVLRYFLQHRDRVVPKDELLEHCWPDAFVGEGALTRCLTKLRKLVHRDPTAPPVLKTVPRQGYRFVAEVTVLPHELKADTVDAVHVHNTPRAQAPESATPSPSFEAAAAPPSAQNESETSAPTEQPSPVAERRQLTVLVCDLVHATALSEQLDPEDLHDVLQAYHAACTEVVGRFDGYVAQYLGDGLLVYFGYPHAQEDAARRAVYTGLSIVRAVKNLNTRLIRCHGIRLAVRLGIHTGLVMMGDVGTGHRVEPLAVGATPNIASRLQGLAAADTVVVSDETWQLVQGYFTCESLGMHPLTDVEAPMAVYRVVEESGAQTPFEATTARSLTTFVGREAELTLFQECWQQVRQGMGQAVVLSGEPGIGKSRLVRAWCETMAQVPHTRLECRCSPYHQHTALYPVVDLLHQRLQTGGAATDDTKLQQLERLVRQCRLDAPESVALLAPLLALPLPAERYAPPQLPPQQQRQRTLETLLAMVLALAERQPVLLVMEDVHWADPSTLEWLGLLLDQGPTVPMLTLMTCRPAFRSPWSGRAHVTSLTLNRLSRQHVERMVRAIAGAETVPNELVEQVVAATDGVPLFVEEVTRLVIASEHRPDGSRYDAGARARPAVTIPATLQDSLMARLDAMGAAKRTAQLGSTIGRQFSYALLRAVSPLAETVLQQDLGTLVAADLLYQRGVGAQTAYVFKHALIQEAAYASLLRRTRQRYHRRIARLLEEQFPDIASSQPELVAYHYVQSEAWEAAFGYLYKAGEKARQAYANQEALAFFTQALEVSDRITPGSERAQLLPVYESRGLVRIDLTEYDAAIADFQAMLEIARALGNQRIEGESLCHLAYTHWLTFSEAHIAFVEQYAQEARQLAQSLGERKILARSLSSLGSVYEVRGQLWEAEQHFQASVELSQQEGYTTPMGYNLTNLSALAYWRGDFPRALALGQEGMSASRVVQDGFHELYSLAFVCIAHWSAGNYRQAFIVLDEGMMKAQERGNAFFLGRLTNTLGWFHRECGDLARAVAYDHESAELGSTSRISNVEISALINLGLDYLALNQPVRALSCLQPTLERVEREAFGAHRWRWTIRLLIGLAECSYMAAEYEQALWYADQGIKDAQATSSQKYVALGWALRGKIAIQLGDTRTAGADLERACALAERLQSPSLIYPMAYDLGQWYETNGKESEAAMLYRKAEATIEQMANAIEDEALRSSFRQSPLIRTVCERVVRLDDPHH
jgi:class 3 adenylate cyclase/tetratricopeptide (TPR) repeat protein